jgi:hypothetical protein
VAFDEDLADRVRSLLADERGLTEKRMFGGLAFLVSGHMAVSASGQGGLLVRVEPADGWLRVEVEAVRTKRQLEAWVARGVAYARSLPPKK